MDIAKLGISIDPSKAESGAKKAKAALKGIGDTAKRELPKIDDGARKGGQSVDRMGRGIKRNFKDMSRGVLDFLDAFGLMNNGFGNMVRRTDSAVRSGENLNRMLKTSKGSTAGVADDLGRMATGAGRAGSGFAAMAGTVAAIAAALAALLVVIGAVIVALKTLSITFGLVKQGIAVENEMEKARVQFAILLNSFEEADGRLKLLRDFAASTPFEFPGIVAASRTMQVFTRGALATEEGLTLVGDAAAAAGRPLDEVAMWVGRLYAGLKGGQPIGEATMRLMEMGLIVPELKGQLDALAQSSNEGGKNFAEIWAMAEGSLKQFEGTMEIQSRTFLGLTSTLRDEWKEFTRLLGAPVQAALKPVLEDLIELVRNLQPYAEKFGQALGTAVQVLYQAFETGFLTEIIALAAIAGMEKAAAFAIELWIKAWATIFQFFIQLATAAIDGTVQLVVQLWTAAIDLITGNLGTGLQKSSTEGSTAFGEAMDTVIEYVGATVVNTLGQAFEDVVNSFYQGFMAAWSKIADLITQGAAALGKDAGLAPVPTGGSIEFFTPRAVPSLDGIGAGLIGTTGQDALAGQVDRLLKGFQEANPQFGEGDLPPAPEEFDPTQQTGPTGGGGGSGSPDKAVSQASGPLTSSFDDLLNSWADTEAALAEGSVRVAQSMANNITDGIVSFIDGTKSAKEAFGDMANAIIADILRMIVQMYVQLALQAAIRAMGGTAHTGGVAGSPNLTQSGGSVPSYHTGGMTSAESMIKVERGETIVTRRRADELEAALDRKQDTGSRTQDKGTTILNVTDQRQILDVIAANPDVLVNTIGRRQPAIRRLAQSKETP